jgi:L-rhamnose 1-dehydrogenase
VLITGGSRGIGRAAARRFAAPGVSIWLAHHHDTEAAADTERELTAAGAEVNTFDGDLGQVAEVDRLLAEIEQRGLALEVLVANAGISPFANVLEVSEADWDRVMNVNLKGLFFLCQRAAEQMMAGGTAGSMVLVSSLSAKVPGRLQPHYSATKAAVLSLARSLTLELAPHGIRVNSVLPGSIQTDIYKPRFTDAEAAAAAELVPLGRIGQPDEVAEAIYFLASPAASYICGAELTIDGGALVAGVPRNPEGT